MPRQASRSSARGPPWSRPTRHACCSHALWLEALSSSSQRSCTRCPRAPARCRCHRLIAADVTDCAAIDSVALFPPWWLSPINAPSTPQHRPSTRGGAQCVCFCKAQTPTRSSRLANAAQHHHMFRCTNHACRTRTQRRHEVAELRTRNLEAHTSTRFGPHLARSQPAVQAT